MRRVVDKPAPHETNEQIDQDDWQHARAERALETFRQLAPKLDPENKQHADESKQRARSSRRRHVEVLEQKAPERTRRQSGPHRQITPDDPGDTRQYPKHEKLRRAIQLLYVWSNDPEA